MRVHRVCGRVRGCVERCSIGNFPFQRSERVLLSFARWLSKTARLAAMSWFRNSPSVGGARALFRRHGMRRVLERPRIVLLSLYGFHMLVLEILSEYS